VKVYPELTTARLTLRRFSLEDAANVQKLAGDREISDTTANVPYPYEDGMAEEWIATHSPRFEEGTLLNFAITLSDSGDLIGAIGLVINPDHKRAELGYWIGKKYWRNGYCFEAAQAVVDYGFEVMRLNKIFAPFMTRNPVSGRVLEKLGMKTEGLFKKHECHHGEFEDIEYRAILREQYLSR